MTTTKIGFKQQTNLTGSDELPAALLSPVPEVAVHTPLDEDTCPTRGRVYRVARRPARLRQLQRAQPPPRVRVAVVGRRGPAGAALAAEHEQLLAREVARAHVGLVEAVALNLRGEKCISNQTK